MDRPKPEKKFPYRRIADELREQIRSGKITDELPSRHELQERYGTSYMTVDRALKVLKDEGLVYAIAGLGTFVR
jgi:DNA-binding GntR family transcriptional regulator